MAFEIEGPEFPHSTPPSQESYKTQRADNKGHRYTTELKSEATAKTQGVWEGTLSIEEEEALPPYDEVIDKLPISFARAQYQGLLQLFEDPSEETKSRLAATVKYIECNEEELIEAAREAPNQSIYIRPPHDRKMAGKNNPFHIQVTIDSEGEAHIYIMPKITELGRGAIKNVRMAIDYSKACYVASATLTIEDEDQRESVLKEKGILEEVLKEMGYPFEFCVYELKQHGGAISQLKAKFIIPLANQGALSKAIGPKGHAEFAKMTLSQKQELFDKMLLFVKCIHDAGYVISDVKPDNILYHINESGKVEVLITDFGTSFKENDPTASKSEGSPTYVAPEQIMGVYDDEVAKTVGRPIDVFALGKTLWEVFIGGQPPWMLDTPCLMRGLYDEREYATIWESYKNEMNFPEGSTELLVLQMMHPSPEARPTLDQIVESRPKLKIGGPNIQGIRLLTAKESANRLKRIRRDKEYNQSEVYALRVSDTHPTNSQFFILERCPSSGPGVIQVHFELLEGGRLKTESGTEYDSLEAYLSDENLKYNANFYYYF